MTMFTGGITKTPKRIKGKVMVVATIQVEAAKRTPYPLRVVGFDVLALELMLCQLGQDISVKGGHKLLERLLADNKKIRY